MPRKLLKTYASIIVFLAVLLLLPAQSRALEEKKKGPHIEGGESGLEFMNRFDLDKDGKISHEEWEAVKPGTVYREKHWPEYNINGDEYITLEEVPEKNGESESAPPEDVTKGPKAGQVAFVVKFDKNKDGKIVRSELPTRLQSRFDQVDRDNNGEVTLDELRRAMSVANRK